MGRFRDYGKEIVISEEIDGMFVEMGFKLDREDVGRKEELSWYKMYEQDGGLHYVHVYVGRESVYAFKEFDVGGFVKDWRIDVSEDILEDREAFADFMDDVFERLGI